MVHSTKTLKIFKIEQNIQFSDKENLLEILNANNVSINQSCGGYGTCTTCRVIVHRGCENLSGRSEIEAERAEERNFAVNERLSCQTEIFGDVEIEILNQDDL